jgi:hypothetical protein
MRAVHQGVCIPRSGLVNKRECGACLPGSTRREHERAPDALRELAIDTCGFSCRAGRVGRQALELFVQCLRVLPVLKRERCPAVQHIYVALADETTSGTSGCDT